MLIVLSDARGLQQQSWNYTADPYRVYSETTHNPDFQQTSSLSLLNIHPAANPNISLNFATVRGQQQNILKA